MAKFEKYSVKSLANKMFCLPLSLANGRECTTTKDILVSCSNLFGRSLVALLPRVVVTVCQNKRGCALSLYTYSNEFLTYNGKRCQESAAGAKCAQCRRIVHETDESRQTLQKPAYRAAFGKHRTADYSRRTLPRGGLYRRTMVQ